MRRISALIAVLLASAIAGSWVAAVSGAPSAELPSPAQLAGKVRGIDTVSVVATAASSAFPDRSRYADPATDDEYFVDSKAGVVTAYISSRVDRPRRWNDNPRLAEITSSADALMERCLPNGPALKSEMKRSVHVVSSRPDDLASSPKSFEGYSDVVVEYHLVRGGVRYPTGFSATYDGDNGELLSLIQVSKPVTIPLESHVSRDEAVRIASASAHVPIHVEDEVFLSVFGAEGAPQRLIWDITLHTGDGGTTSGTTVHAGVDAKTGAVMFGNW